MNIGSSAADIGLVVLLLFPALLAPVVFIGVGLLLGRVLRLPGVFAAFFALAVCGALLVGGSLYLDERWPDRARRGGAAQRECGAALAGRLAAPA